MLVLATDLSIKTQNCFNDNALSSTNFFSLFSKNQVERVTFQVLSEVLHNSSLIKITIYPEIRDKTTKTEFTGILSH